MLGDLHLISHPIGFLTSPGWAFVTVLIANIWIGIPFFTVLLYSALQDVPIELKEAAMLDGANAWQRLVRVTVPVICPVIEVVFVLGFVSTIKVFDVIIGLTQGGPAAVITVAVFAFLQGWGDFIFALTLLSGSAFEPITLSIYSYIGEFSSNLGEAMALCVFGLLPAAMLLIAAQRYITAGLTVGSVKG